MTFLLATLAATAPVQMATLPDPVGQAALEAGDPAEAIARIDADAAIETGDPARLINLGIAYGRQGRDALARQMFEAAASSERRYRLETAEGRWVDSRHLARMAMRMLDRGDLRTSDRIVRR